MTASAGRISSGLEKGIFNTLGSFTRYEPDIMAFGNVNIQYMPVQS